MLKNEKRKAYYHLPGLFDFYEFYKVFFKLFHTHREYFYDWCEIGSVYGAPSECLWGGGRVEMSDQDPEEIAALLEQYEISGRLAFSNSQLETEHLSDKKCNHLCEIFHQSSGVDNGVIIYSDLLLKYLRDCYPNLYYVSSTTKVLTDFSDFKKELDKEYFKYVVPDFRLNKSFGQLRSLSQLQKDKVEFLCNECCWIGCMDRKRCYEAVSRRNLGIDDPHACSGPDAFRGYRFSKAMENPAFISVEDIRDIYLPMGFTNYKIEGRGLGSAVVLEMLIYYMVKPEYSIHVREEIYLDNMLDLF